MIRNTFCHVPSISEATEARLWDSGIHSWDDFAERGSASLSPRKAASLRKEIEQSSLALDRCDPKYFSEKLPANQHWRLFREFRSSLAYLDIETTGMGGYDDHITTIALYDGRSIFHYVHGESLQAFKNDIQNYAILVTYNGKCFDVPVIERYFGIRMPQAHIDLRYVLRSLGYRGGLKGCERQLGIDRKDLHDVDGYFAVLLWNEYQRSGNRNALDTLLAYNIEDVVNLETLLVLAYNMKLAQTPLATKQCVALPRRPHVPFHADSELIESLRMKVFASF